MWGKNQGDVQKRVFFEDFVCLYLFIHPSIEQTVIDVDTAAYLFLSKESRILEKKTFISQRESGQKSSILRAIENVVRNRFFFFVSMDVYIPLNFAI